MPVSAASPLQNRGSYKPPQMMKRPAEGVGGRSALGDVTNLGVGMGGDGEKRQRIAMEGGEREMLNI